MVAGCVNSVDCVSFFGTFIGLFWRLWFWFAVFCCYGFECVVVLVFVWVLILGFLLICVFVFGLVVGCLLWFRV